MSSTKMSVNDTIEIGPGVSIPRIGFGVYKSAPEVCVKSCLEAYKAGYKHFDSAMYYANELSCATSFCYFKLGRKSRADLDRHGHRRNRKQVGEAVRQSGAKREELFITTKIIAPPEEKTPEATYDALEKAVAAFGLGNDRLPPAYQVPFSCIYSIRLRRPVPHPHSLFRPRR
jgi:hypothetical protein